MIYIAVTILLFTTLLLYFRIADRYNIIDHPNERSSHFLITIRGGGIIFLFAALVILMEHFKEFYLPAISIIIIGTISFLDDIHTLPNKLRIAFHFIAVTIVFIYFNIFNTLSWYYIGALYIIFIGVINAYNFMDGINGITGTYSLVVLLGLQWINLKQIQFVNPDMIWMPVLACLVFLFFNFRKNAKCFAGDVGSVTIALWIALLIFQVIFKTNNWKYFLFLAVYGVDAVLTIIHRLLLKENVFKAHRFHFYQLLANEKKVPHLTISGSYAFAQGLIIIVILNLKLSILNLYLIVLVPIIMIYIIIKPKLLKH